MPARVDGIDFPVLGGHAHATDHRVKRQLEPLVQVNLVLVDFEDAHFRFLDILAGNARLRPHGEHAGTGRLDLLDLDRQYIADAGFFHVDRTGYGYTLRPVGVSMGIGFVRKKTPIAVLRFHYDGFAAAHRNGR